MSEPIISEHVEDYEALPIGAGLGVNMAAGALAGISEHAVMFPIDSIKTRMQILPSVASASTAYNTLSSSIARVSATEGLKTLWKGVNSVILGAGPAHAVYFGTYEIVKDLAGGNRPGHQFTATALGGAAATIASDALMNPFDVIKQRMQLRGSTYKNVGHAFRSVYKAEGISAFYVSYPTTLMMTVPFTAVQFTAYEYLKDTINPSGSYSPGTHIIAGGAAGAIAAAISTPLDVLKTLLQTRGTSADERIRKANGIFEAGRIVWAREGLKGFSRGLAPRVVTYVPSNALSWLAYEGFKVFLKEPSSPAHP
ncbi:mitochondrial carrier [Phaffia rhodozyma]|uniref:Mitochondrial carrier n=1 Tax=Phaffia rhodozyma TaxID=264483 RepID=A0A0F7SG05_PHARH|nr:mitochondrial carrier [Phaffia rhodozyma]